MITIQRRAALFLPLLVAACASTPPRAPLSPISYRYLTRLALNVGQLDISNREPPPPPYQMVTEISPIAAVQIMGRDRLVAVGNSGRAVFTVTAAQLSNTPLSGGGGMFTRGPSGRLDCYLACRVEIFNGHNQRVGFTDAEARRSRTLADGISDSDAHYAAEELLRQTMGDLNVEFEYQLRRNLSDWLVQNIAPGGGIPDPMGNPASQGIQMQPLPGSVMNTPGTPGAASSAVNNAASNAASGAANAAARGASAAGSAAGSAANSAASSAAGHLTLPQGSLGTLPLSSTPAPVAAPAASGTAPF